MCQYLYVYSTQAVHHWPLRCIELTCTFPSQAEIIDQPSACPAKSKMTKLIGTSDTVIRPVIVEPEGAPRDYTVSNFVCMTLPGLGLYISHMLRESSSLVNTSWTSVYCFRCHWWQRQWKLFTASATQIRAHWGIRARLRHSRRWRHGPGFV